MSETGLKDISLTIYGLKKTIKGLSEYTVCDDVIETVFDRLAINKVYASSFAIYESASGVERQLSGKTRVLKLVRSWGADHEKSELIMKRVGNSNENVDTKQKNVSSSTGNERYGSERKSTSMSENYCNIYSQENRTKLKRFKGSSKIQNCSRSSKTVKSEQMKPLRLPSTPETSGKMFILKKFMNDVMIYNDRMNQHSSKLQTIPRAPGDGSDFESVLQNISPIRNNESRFSALEYNIRTPGDGEHSDSCSIDSIDNDFLVLDNTKVKTDKQLKVSCDLNDAFIVTVEDVFENVNEQKEYGTFCAELENFNGDCYDGRNNVKAPELRGTRRPENGGTLKYILALAGSATSSSSSSEDSLIESFMNTKLHEEKSFRQCL